MTAAAAPPGALTVGPLRPVIRYGPLGLFGIWLALSLTAIARGVVNTLRLRFADAGECRRALAAAGFAAGAVAFATHELAWTVPSASFLFEAQRDAAVRTAAVLAAQSSEAQERIQDAVEREVRRYAVAQGFAVPMAAHVVTAAVEA